MTQIVQQPSLHSGTAKVCKVDIIAEPGPGAPDGVCFSIASALKQQNGELLFDKKADKLKTADHYQVEFELKDRTQFKLSFPDDPAAAIWVSAGRQDCAPECPTEQCRNEEVYGVEVCDSGKKLAVRNNNSKKEWVAFTLRFIKGSGPTDESPSYLLFDPIIQNKNGGIDAL